jgi:hypothetical protein
MKSVVHPAGICLLTAVLETTSVLAVGADFSIELEPPVIMSLQFSDDEVARYHGLHALPGTPPLAEIREHIVRAMTIDRTRGETDSSRALRDAFVDKFGRAQWWWDEELTATSIALGVIPLREFQQRSDEYIDAFTAEQVGSMVDDERRKKILFDGSNWNRWCSASDGLNAVRALRQHFCKDTSERAEWLLSIESILQIAQREGRRWRFLVFW